MSRKYFGTDGIRGQVGDEPITPKFVMQLGWAVGKVLARMDDGDHQGMVLIGKDTRISGYMFESALEAGLISAGVDVGLLGPMPTPGIAYLTRTFKNAKAGIVISASHNPYTDNGFKIFSAEGTKLPDEIEDEIEKMLDQPMTTEEHLGKAWRMDDAQGRYIEFCKGSLPWGFSLRGLKIVLDCANGATYNIAPKVFSELGAEVEVIACEPDGVNINLNCGSTHMDRLQQEVVARKAELGIAFDGDGDRVMFVDHKGEVVDGDELLVIIASYCRDHLGGCNGVVGTQMSNLGMQLALEEIGVPFARSKVGDRYVNELMTDNGWLLGGESSGHIVCRDLTTTGDGIVSALRVLSAINTEGKCLHDLKQRMTRLPQVIVNVPVNDKQCVVSDLNVQSNLEKVEEVLGANGRVLLRPSGTEPLIRVMVEGKQQEQIQMLADELAEVVANAASS
ncbi:phosphoglucosamine mutase [Teredinibacter sp. KSP-S5-2]|uniref:phosphoglucosamine mutase n=1 Tax=Teredinibacter sp. KSP-S5-2 TaxID=3034506 RepID=UPI0029341B12|nr:phosphoglucosamine mutase [Teredinibacter sp. KSP-S5-2]WNO08219.1 phosphoglucosamine mutase [Teredinibacter sp. KSP-S5-2]